MIADIRPEAEARAAEWGRALLRTNVDETAGVEALCKEAVNRFGKLDIMINNAGIASGHLLADADAARSERFWRVHILGVQMGIKEAAARMTAGGTIVNISSITAMRGFVPWGEYAPQNTGNILVTHTQ